MGPPPLPRSSLPLALAGRDSPALAAGLSVVLGFSNKNRLLDGDEYWLDLNGFTL